MESDSKTPKKVLMLIPAESASGGIKHYYSVLKDRFTIPVEYMHRGARNWPYRESKLTELKRIITDLYSFYRKVNANEYSIVQTSTSFGWFSLIRDGVYLYIARRKGIKTIAFYRGWSHKVQQRLERRGLWLYKRIFMNVSASITLSEKVSDTLRGWGFKNSIFVETTLFDEGLLENVNIDEHLKEKSAKQSDTFHVLFLARIEKEKGIFEALQALKILQDKNPDKTIRFTVGGSGRADEEIKQVINQLGLQNVEVLGYVTGEEKKQAYLNADCYLFPTYREGMPNSILEAMAFGLPIISRPVGSIPEIVKTENGFLSDSYDPEVFASFLQQLLDNRLQRSEMSFINSNFAKQNFYSEMVLRRLEKIYSEVAYGTTNTGA